MKYGSVDQKFASLPLEILLYFNWHYSAFFFVLNVALLTFKSLRYYYPGRALGWDFAIIFMYLFVEFFRLFHLSKGNKTTNIFPVLWGLLFCIPVLALHGYYLDLQTYVTRVDTVLNALALFFVCSEFLIGFITICIFYFYSKKF